MRSNWSLYRAIAKRTAPPTTAATSRVSPAVVRAAAPVARPGWAPVVVALDPVGVTWTTVMEVMVLLLPSGRVLVLL